MIDYVLARAEGAGKIVRILAEREKELPYPVRVIVLERECQGPWVGQFVGVGSDRQLTESAAYHVLVATQIVPESRDTYNQAPRLDPLQLQGIDELSLWSIISAAFRRSGKRLNATA